MAHGGGPTKKVYVSRIRHESESGDWLEGARSATPAELEQWLPSQSLTETELDALRIKPGELERLRMTKKWTQQNGRIMTELL